MNLQINKINFEKIVFFIVIGLFLSTISYLIIKPLFNFNEFSDYIYILTNFLIFEILLIKLSSKKFKFLDKKLFEYLILFIFFILTFFLWIENMPKLNISFFLYLFFVLAPITYYIYIITDKLISTHDKKILFLISLITSVIFKSLIFENLSIDLTFVVYLSLIFLTLSTLFMMLKKIKFNYLDIFLSLIFFILFIKIFLYSSPKDNFHYSVVVGPINSILNGGNLLNDTLSQYGYLNILIVKYLSFFFNGDVSKTLIFFILFLFIIFSILFINIVKKETTLPYFLIVSFVSMISFGNLGYSNLTGAMFIPSSSVFRFLPAVVTILLLINLIKDNNKNFFINSSFFFLSVLISTLWSFESLFFIYFSIIGTSVIFFISNYLTKKKIINIKLFSINRIKTIYCFALITLYLLILFYIIGYYDFSLFYESTLNLKQSALSKELIMSETSLILIFFFIINYYFWRESFQKILLVNFYINSLLFLLLIAFSSYYLVRSHPNNLFNILPYIFFLTCLIKPFYNEGKIYKKIFINTFIYFSLVAGLFSFYINYDILKKNIKNKNLILPNFSKDYKPSIKIKNILSANNNIPVTLITGKTVHNINFKINSNGYGMPILPLETFNRASNDRKKKIMQLIFSKNKNHLLLCIFDCNIYTEEKNRKSWNDIFIHPDYNIKKLSEEDIKNEKLFLISKN